MPAIGIKNFATDSDVITPHKARVETVNIGGQRVMKCVAQPGWVWSEDIQSLVGTQNCEAKHHHQHYLENKV